ncbi:MAG: hypothetical protein Q9226_007600 [Calogaya cf. arnoldii]
MHNPLIFLTTLLILHTNLTTSQPLPSNGADNMDLTAETMPGAPQPEDTMSTTPLEARGRSRGPDPGKDDPAAHLIPKLVPRGWNSFWKSFWELTVGSRGIKHPRALAARGNFAPLQVDKCDPRARLAYLYPGSIKVKPSRKSCKGKSSAKAASVPKQAKGKKTTLVARDDKGWSCVWVQFCPKTICKKKYHDCGLI